MIPLLTLSILFQPMLPAIAESISLKTITANSHIETSIEVAKELNSKSNTYVIATSIDYPDALAGTVLASKFNAPILFVNLYDNQKVFDYLESQNVDKSTKFYILGGQAVVTLMVEQTLRAISPNVVRLGGWTKYDTANLINEYLDTKQGLPVIVATGIIYPDALSMGAIGGQFQYPIYLVDFDSVSQDTVDQLQRIKPTTVYIAGGTGIIPQKIENQIKNFLPSTNIVRLAGYDRYETSSIVADYFSSYMNEKIYTTGEDFHSALVAAPLASQHKASINLVDNISPEFEAKMNRQKGYRIGDIKVVRQTLPLEPGGPAITAFTEDDIRYLQRYKQFDGNGGSYKSFDVMYAEEKGGCEALIKKFSPSTLSDYSQAKVEWLSTPTLVYRSLISQYCVRGILSLTYDSGDNKFGLTPNTKYQREVEFRIRNSMSSYLKLEETVYFSDFVQVK